MRWWSGLQPEWRQGSGPLPPALYVCDAGEWGPLRNCGKNGVALVLLAAAWYARQFGAKPEWITAVTDVRRALEGMVQGGVSVGGKCAASSVITSNSTRPIKRYAQCSYSFSHLLIFCAVPAVADSANFPTAAINHYYYYYYIIHENVNTNFSME